MKKVKFILCIGLIVSLFTFNYSHKKDVSILENNITAFSEQNDWVVGIAQWDKITLYGFTPGASVYCFGQWTTANSDGEVSGYGWVCNVNHKCQSYCSSDGDGNCWMYY